MPLFGNRPTNPTPTPGLPPRPTSTWPPKPSLRPGQVQKPVLQNPAQKPSTFGFLFGKPSPTQGQIQRKASSKPGFLERGGFRRHNELITEIKKQSYYKGIPGSGVKYTQKQRAALITELEKLGRGSGGITGEKLGYAIKKLRKMKELAPYHREFGKIKELDRKIKQAQDWKKTWEQRKF